ncbi:predicted protein [Arabidopsis lyrata subsp. lyrata]|uniref:Predicted protein n=1 Tax=Arabidopsis lyrata subsp. lyrata TaxID=81972 RepID=D7LGS7_ARALL|nr:predicted protein [Arabidopsis lyrata subsp. lyrata]
MHPNLRSVVVQCYRLGFGGKTLVSRPDRGFCSQTGSKGEKAVTEYRKIYALSPVGVVLYSAFCVWGNDEIILIILLDRK